MTPLAKKRLALIGLVIVFLPVWLPLTLRALGFYVNEPGWWVAERLVEKSQGVEKCKKTLIMPWYIFSPSGSDQRDTCIYTYAELTRNPSICELLLPREYGLACLSTTWGKIMGDLPCVKVDGKNWVSCDQQGGNDPIRVDNPQIESCNLYTRNDLREWCHYSRSAYLKDMYECMEIETTLVRDDCEMSYAFKQKDSSLCSAVQDEKRRQYCEIRINTWLQYPELRDSFYFGQKVPVDEEALSVP